MPPPGRVTFDMRPGKRTQNGLFQTKKEIIEYISRREEYEKTHKPYTLEVGDFTVFEVYEVIL